MKAFTALVCAALMAGCTTSPPTSGVSRTQAVYRDDLRAARQHTEEASGRLEQRLAMNASGIASQTLRIIGDYDGATGNFSTVQDWLVDEKRDGTASESVLLMAESEVRSRRVNGIVYQTSTMFPKRFHGRWVRMTERDIAVSGRPRPGPIPTKLLDLIDEVTGPVDRAQTGNGGHVYRLAVPTAAAARAADYTFKRGDQPVTPPSGVTPVEITVDNLGRITELTVDLTGAWRTFSAGMHEDAKRLTVMSTLRISDFGKRVTVRPPRAELLVDPSEMN